MTELLRKGEKNCLVLKATAAYCNENVVPDENIPATNGLS